jgi:hypothetical protein
MEDDLAMLDNEIVYELFAGIGGEIVAGQIRNPLMGNQNS